MRLSSLLWNLTFYTGLLFFSYMILCHVSSCKSFVQTKLMMRNPKCVITSIIILYIYRVASSLLALALIKNGPSFQENSKTTIFLEVSNVHCLANSTAKASYQSHMLILIILLNKIVHTKSFNIFCPIFIAELYKLGFNRLYDITFLDYFVGQLVQNFHM